MAWSNGYSYRRAITIDHTKCGSADSTNWPFYFTGHADLKTTANGGYVTSSSGYDIIFTSDAAGSTTLSYERVSWSATTGLGEFHVKIPTLDADADTVIYLWYGNASITTDQSNKTGTWNSAYTRVYHLGDGSTLNCTDSTSNADNGTPTSTYPSAASGQIGGSAYFDGSAGKKISLTGYTVSKPYTFSAWIKTPDTGVYVQPLFIGGNTGSYELRLDTSRHLVVSKAQYADESRSSGTTTVNAWTHVVSVKDSSGNYAYYLNGSVSGSFSTGAVSFIAATNRIGIGDSDSSTYQGYVDEVRWSNTNRSASWISAEYANQSSPSTFYTLGAADPGLSIPVLAYYYNRRRLQ